MARSDTRAKWGRVGGIGRQGVRYPNRRMLRRGPFGELLRAMLRDAALLIWLDAPSNRKGHPNENLARELMELFTLGVGSYSEQDVKEAARALTGRTVALGEYRRRASDHDD